MRLVLMVSEVRTNLIRSVIPVKAAFEIPDFQNAIKDENGGYMMIYFLPLLRPLFISGRFIHYVEDEFSDSISSSCDIRT